MGNFFSQKVRSDDHEGDSRYGNCNRYGHTMAVTVCYCCYSCENFGGVYRSAACSTIPTPITDSLSNEVRGLLNQIEVPYEKCLNALREKEQQLNRYNYVSFTVSLVSITCSLIPDVSQKDELERHKIEFHREKEQLEQEKKRCESVLGYCIYLY